MNICPKCGQDNIEIMVDVMMVIPSRMENRLSKTSLRSKDVKIQGVNWPRATYICNTEGCHWVHSWRRPESYVSLLTETH